MSEHQIFNSIKEFINELKCFDVIINNVNKEECIRVFKQFFDTDKDYIKRRIVSEKTVIHFPNFSINLREILNMCSANDRRAVYHHLLGIYILMNLGTPRAENAFNWYNGNCGKDFIGCLINELTNTDSF